MVLKHAFEDIVTQHYLNKRRWTSGGERYRRSRAGDKNLRVFSVLLQKRVSSLIGRLKRKLYNSPLSNKKSHMQFVSPLISEKD